MYMALPLQGQNHKRCKNQTRILQENTAAPMFFLNTDGKLINRISTKQIQLLVLDLWFKQKNGVW